MHLERDSSTQPTSSPTGPSSVPATTATRMTQVWRPLGLALAVTVIAVLATSLICSVIEHLHSDHVYLHTLARDVLRGRSLTGWRLQPAPSFVPDGLVVLLLTSLHDDGVFVHAAHAVLLFSAIVLGAAGLHGRVHRAMRGTDVLAIALLLLVVSALDGSLRPGLSNLQIAVLPGHHTWPVPIWFLVGMVLVQGLRARFSPFTTTGVAVLVLLSAASDPIVLPHVVAPATAAVAVTVVVDIKGRRPRVVLVALICLGFAGYWGHFAQTAWLGKLLYPLSQSLSAAKWRPGAMFEALIDFATMRPLFALAWGVGVGLAIAGTVRSVFARKTSRAADQVFGHVYVLASVTFGLVAAAGRWSDAGNVRYLLVPLLSPIVWAFIAWPREVGGFRLAGTVLSAGMVVLGVRTAWLVGPELRSQLSGDLRPPFVKCVDELAQSDDALRYGYGEYWRAKVVSSLSRAGVHVNEVDRQLNRRRWISNLDWYLDDGHGDAPAHRFLLTKRLDLKAVRKRFGEPRAQIKCGNEAIWVYDRPEDEVFQTYIADGITGCRGGLTGLRWPDAQPLPRAKSLIVRVEVDGDRSFLRCVPSPKFELQVIAKWSDGAVDEWVVPASIDRGPPASILFTWRNAALRSGDVEVSVRMKDAEAALASFRLRVDDEAVAPLAGMGRVGLEVPPGVLASQPTPVRLELENPGPRWWIVAEDGTSELEIRTRWWSEPPGARASEERVSLAWSVPPGGRMTWPIVLTAPDVLGTFRLDARLRSPTGGDDDALPGAEALAALPQTRVLPHDAPAPCRADADCSDERHCNGTEACAPHVSGSDERGCIAQAPPCTRDLVCDEPSRTCLRCTEGSDGDHDGHDAAACGGRDCDDLDPQVFPGAAESCNRRDDDCDGEVDEGLLVSGFVDRDLDGFGDDTKPAIACPATGHAAQGGDCDDLAPGFVLGDWAHCHRCNNPCGAREACRAGQCAPARRIFLTSTTHSGDLGGLEGANEICRQRAAAAGLGGRFEALLSLDDSGVERFAATPDVPIVLLDGREVAKSFSELVDGTTAVPVALTETRRIVRKAGRVWTGPWDGGPKAKLSNDCNDWTTKESPKRCCDGHFGIAGDPHATNTKWDGFELWHCHTKLHLYCLER